MKGTTEYRPKIPNYNRRFITLLTIVGSIGGFILGYCSTIVSGAQLYFKDDWPEITSVQREMIVSLSPFGGIIGSLIAGPLSNKLGRRAIIIIADVFLTFGSIHMAFAPSISHLYVGRLFIGIGSGLMIMTLTCYLTEICPMHVRGTIVAIYILALTIGQVSAGVVCLILDRDWRLMFGLSSILSLVQGIWMLFMPESARYLAINQREEQLKKVMWLVYPDESEFMN